MILAEQFTDMILKHRDCLKDRNVFYGYMKGSFLDDPILVEVVTALYSFGIVREIQESDTLDAHMFRKYIRQIVVRQEYDIGNGLEALRLWFYGYGESVLGKKVSVKLSVKNARQACMNADEADDDEQKRNDQEDEKDSDDSTFFQDLSGYLDALQTEIIFLKYGGGRRYSITNGELYDKRNGIYTYNFELESEIFLSDDAPLTIYVGDQSANGNVLACEGFHILINVDVYFGEEVKKAYITVEPWKILLALKEKLSVYSRLGWLAKLLLEKGPDMVAKGGIQAIRKGQEMARSYAKKNEITIIWGPPGTGKTYTMSQIALDALKAGLSVLMVSHSNISVDGAVESLIDRVKEENYLYDYKQGLYLRYGFVRSKKLQEDEYAVSYNYALKNRPDIAEEMQKLNEKKKKLRREKADDKIEIAKIEKRLKALRSIIKEEEKKYIKKAKYIATTISKVIMDSIFDEKNYDLVLFDEASMAYVPQVVLAASHAKKHFVCVGDFLQLPPIAQSSAKPVLTKDIFQYLGISNEKAEINNHEWLVMLDVQRRMHSAISAFPNEYVYSGILKNAVETDEKRAEIVERSPLPNKAVCLVDLSGTYCAASKDDNNSRFNILAAIIDFANALTAQKAGEDSIGIVSPYKAQTRLIQAMIKDEFDEKENNILCSTVHSFQGYERNLMIFDPVESYPTTKAGFLMSKDVNQVKRLINVAVTRARGKLLVVSYANFWRQQFEGSKNLCYQLVEYLSDTMAKGNKKRQVLFKKYLASLDYGKNITFYPEVSEGIEALFQDVEKAKKEIIVSMPDASMMESDESKEIFIKLTQTLKRGIGIKIFITEKTKMPAMWKEFTEVLPQAVFPLIMIDGKVLWHGLPAYAKGFTLKDGTVTVNMQMVYRISGKYTIGILANMTQMAAVDLVMEDLNTGEKIKRSGLSEYLYETCICKKCHSHMKLAKKNRYHMRCENCSEVDFVPIDLVREYINENGITCPIDGGRIKAGISRTGIYLLCERGHFIELNQI